MSAPVDARDAVQALVETIWRLRQPDGCPWDRAQTHISIAGCMIEEAHEALAAIEEGDTNHLREELGDVLMQVVLHAQIAADANEFTLVDVARDLDAKLVRRHPHVFGEEAAAGAEEAVGVWDRVKLEERVGDAARDSGGDGLARAGLLDSVPRALPALLQAQNVSRKAAAVGFDWASTPDVWDQVDREREEFNDELPGTPERELEFGDLLFSLVNVARKEHIDAERALRAATSKFRARWEAVERLAAQVATTSERLSARDLNTLWDQAKAEESTMGDSAER